MLNRERIGGYTYLAQDLRKISFFPIPYKKDSDLLHTVFIFLSYILCKVTKKIDSLA